MSTYKDVYGILELLAMRNQKSLSFEFSHQLRNKQPSMNDFGRQPSCIKNNFRVNPYLMWNEDAYDIMYENIWEGFFNAT